MISRPQRTRMQARRRGHAAIHAVDPCEADHQLTLCDRSRPVPGFGLATRPWLMYRARTIDPTLDLCRMRLVWS